MPLNLALVDETLLGEVVSTTGAVPAIDALTVVFAATLTAALSAALTVARSTSEPAFVGTSTIVTLAVVGDPVLLELIVPSEHVTVFPPVQEPCDALQEKRSVFAGRVSLSTVPVAGPDP